MKPLLKWVGGKRRILPEVEQALRDVGYVEGSTLVEPFCGGMAVTLSLLPKTSIIGDIGWSDAI